MNSISSLGFRSDLMLLSLQGSDIEQRDGYLVVRTPTNPTFHWGNFILLEDAPETGSVRRWIDVFRSEFPNASHLAIGVDGTSGDAGRPDELAAEHLEVGHNTVLSAAVIRPPARLNRDAVFRMLDATDDADWEAALALQEANFPSLGDGGEFARRRLSGHRELQRRGCGGWFGAFLGDRMVSGLGLFGDDSGLVRYQNVDTHPEFRNRGLAGSLVLVAGRYAFEQLHATSLVIVADPEYTAITLYRELGFDGTETQLQLSRTAE
jgi:ribosomal protein S18 acetylase RimI-like enzyme